MTLLWYSTNIIFGQGDKQGKEEWSKKEKGVRKEEKKKN